MSTHFRLFPVYFGILFVGLIAIGCFFPSPLDDPTESPYMPHLTIHLRRGGLRTADINWIKNTRGAASGEWLMASCPEDIPAPSHISFWYYGEGPANLAAALDIVSDNDDTYEQKARAAVIAAYAVQDGFAAVVDQQWDQEGAVWDGFVWTELVASAFFETVNLNASKIRLLS